MNTVLIICLLWAGASYAFTVDESLNDTWRLFKRIYKKQYASNEQELAR